MFTLITGNPGAGKTLYAVWELLRPVPGSFAEDAEGKQVARRLLANIPELVLDHEKLDAELISTWHTWAKPGDVICGDEIQHIFRPRTMGTKIPPAIEAVETHRHLGVDLIFITQHPNLMDVNLRRLVNRHLHMRRITPGVSMVYEWDHCGRPGDYKGCLSSKLWRHKKAGYALYKSAQLHTKPTTRVPAIASLGIASVAALAFVGPWAYARVSESLSPPEAVAKVLPAVEVKEGPAVLPAKLPEGVTVVETPAVLPVAPTAPAFATQPPAVAGCAQVRTVCECFTAEGEKVPTDPEVCEARLPRAILPPALAALQALTPDGTPTRDPDSLPRDADLIAWAARRR